VFRIIKVYLHVMTAITYLRGRNLERGLCGSSSGVAGKRTGVSVIRNAGSHSLASDRSSSFSYLRWVINRSPYLQGSVL
jgi:hypothetical protein